MQFALILGSLLLLATIATGIATAITRRRKLAEVCRVLALATALLGVLGTIAGLLVTAAAASAPGLTDADRQRMWSNGIAEALYNIAIALVVAVPALLIAWRTTRGAAA